jgi:hypothetical protein
MQVFVACSHRLSQVQVLSAASCSEKQSMHLITLNTSGEEYLNVYELQPDYTAAALFTVTAVRTSDSTMLWFRKRRLEVIYENVCCNCNIQQHMHMDGARIARSSEWLLTS